MVLQVPTADKVDRPAVSDKPEPEKRTEAVIAPDLETLKVSDQNLLMASEKENYLFLQTPLVPPALTFLFPLVLASPESPVFLLVPPSPESLVIPPSFF
ncbi:hypothetical protein DPX16_6284 [Anabarilius grahami]|uniref:Uncharacterized protein n=1 Tax=Anabarilius grahami TaxID=495550 RepID=A0A3N0YK28_ANAGA|nr:hypothetical protein DPX16_6284 [Anabarilius grahami]